MSEVVKPQRQVLGTANGCGEEGVWGTPAILLQDQRQEVGQSTSPLAPLGQWVTGPFHDGPVLHVLTAFCLPVLFQCHRFTVSLTLCLGDKERLSGKLPFRGVLRRVLVLVAMCVGLKTCRA